MCVSESNLGDCCNLDLKGFNCHMNNRVQLSASPSGNLALLISEKILKYIAEKRAQNVLCFVAVMWISTFFSHS